MSLSAEQRARFVILLRSAAPAVAATSRNSIQCRFDLLEGEAEVDNRLLPSPLPATPRLCAGRHFIYNVYCHSIAEVMSQGRERMSSE